MTFEDAIAAWLPGQRWYSGGTPVRGLTVTSDILLATGDPEMRHLIVAVRTPSGVACYQVPVGISAAPPPAATAGGGIGGEGPAGGHPAGGHPAGGHPAGGHPASPVIGPAGGGRVAYDALSDPRLARVLVDGIVSGRTAGPLRFTRQPGAAIDTNADGVLLRGEQSNTSLVFGDCAVLKVLRRVFPGTNPDLEVTLALARRGSRQVKAPLGWIEAAGTGNTPAGAGNTRAGDAGPPGSTEPALLAVLSQYLPAAGDGWSLATASVRAACAGDPDHQSADRAGATGGFAAEAYRLGEATARVHRDLAAAFGVTEGNPATLAAGMAARLAAARAEVPALRGYAAGLGERFAELARSHAPVPLQRVHGDYHLGQVLRAEAGWVALDFEGEPATPLAERRAPAPALRDVAGLLRSLEYAAGHALLGAAARGAGRATARQTSGREAGRDAGAPAPRERAEAWVRGSQQAFCAGYAAAGGAHPAADDVLLRALVLDKAVYEVVYEARHRPSWLPVPLRSIAAAVAR